MADRHDAVEVERGVEAGERVDRRRDVLERDGVAAAAHLADAPVLDVPGGEAAARQVAGVVVHEVEGVLLAPEAAVDDDRDGERPGALGYGEVAELVEVGSVTVTHTMARRMAQAPTTWILTRSPGHSAALRAPVGERRPGRPRAAAGVRA